MTLPVLLPVPAWLGPIVAPIVVTGPLPVALPVPRSVKIDKPRMINWGGPLTPQLGGAVQVIQRLGTRHAIDITIPVMPAEPNGRIWSSRLRQARLYGALVPYRQDGLAIGTPGSPVVGGESQSGPLLVMGGFTAGYTVREGQAFSILTNGRIYLHFAAADAVAAGDGTLTLPIFPMLRIYPNAGDHCEFPLPYLQGSLSGNETSWTRLTAPYADFGSITVTEDE